MHQQSAVHNIAQQVHWKGINKGYNERLGDQGQAHSNFQSRAPKISLDFLASIIQFLPPLPNPYV